MTKPPLSIKQFHTSTSILSKIRYFLPIEDIHFIFNAMCARMNTEQLIEEVSCFPVLYDQAHEKYRNAEYKERVWKTIAETLDASAEDCKKKWTSIRDQQRRTLQKRKAKSGQAAGKNHKYKYEDNLTFLMPHMAVNGNMCIPEDEVDGTDDELPNDSQDLAQEDLLLKVEEPSSSPIPLIMRKRKMHPSQQVKSQECPASQFMSFILEEKNKMSTVNSVDSFLGAIAPTLKSLDPVLLHKTKGKIFTIVHEAEFAQLNSTSYL